MKTINNMVWKVEEANDPKYTIKWDCIILMSCIVANCMPPEIM